MKILLTGSNGYIGKRLLPVLIDMNYEIVCCVRDINRFHAPKEIRDKVEIIELDLLKDETLKNIPKDIDGAFYLVHSMSESKDYEKLEIKSAQNFCNTLNSTQVKHVVYLSGIINETNLSDHLSSRKNVEIELNKGHFNTTTLRAGIIIGSGSASFEIIRDLVEKLPLMITPIWLKTKCQPIGIYDVISFLSKTIFNNETYNKNYDIGGPDILSYKEMLLGFSRVRNLNRKIFIVPVMTPKLSSYWLYFVTSTSYKLAAALVDSMKIEVVCRDQKINKILGIVPLGYQENLKKAFSRINSNNIISSWKDAYSSSGIKINISKLVEVPSFGCFKDKRTKKFLNKEKCIDKIWNIGGENGWYYGNWLWRIRGLMDKMSGGVGLRRGRTNINSLNAGDALDFWRVIFANKKNGHLLLFAEMKLPGEAWLEFKIENGVLTQTATFRPLGVWGRFYWYLVLPFHGFIFKGMLKKITS